METIAVYWEDRIRTYGLNLMEGLVLWRFTVPTGRIGEWAALLQTPELPDSAFRLVWAQTEGPGQMRICIASPETDAARLPTTLHPSDACRDAGDRLLVDVLYFQGPHFGDRYGIMDYTLAALLPKHIPLLGSVCAMATIYLIVPGGWGGPARDVLNQAFDIPQSAGKGNADARGGADR